MGRGGRQSLSGEPDDFVLIPAASSRNKRRQQPAWRPKPVNASLFTLPWEVRDTIYAYCLIEPVLWEKRHKRECAHTPRNSTTLEEPPFVSQRCRCAKREGVSLLGVCRKIHQETAHMFWTKNAFAWPECASFIIEVMHKLRPEYQVLIRHVSIMRETPEHDANIMSDWRPVTKAVWEKLPQPYSLFHSFWDALKLCKGVRTVEVRPDYILRNHDFLRTLTAHLPELESLSLIRLQRDKLKLSSPADGTIVYIKSGRAVNLAKLTDYASCRALMRDFDTNFQVHLRYAIETDVFGRPGALFNQSNRHTHPLRLPDDMTDRHHARELTLRDKTTSTIHVYGTPLAPATVLAHERARVTTAQVLLYTTALRRRAGLPTVQEAKLQRAVAAQQKTKRATQRHHDELLHATARLADRQARETYWLEQEEAERAEAARARERRAMAVAAAAKERAQNRKRRPRTDMCCYARDG